MNGATPTAAGWYPDPESGGTKYWDGSGWTGDARPQRKQFAAASAHKGWGITLIIVGVLFVVTSPAQFSQTSTNGSSPLGAFFFAIVAGIIAVGLGVYLFRGQGPTSKDVEARAAAARQESRARNLLSSPAPAAPSVVVNVAAPKSDAAAAAQIKALSDPQTAKALQDLQNLLFTHTITDAEYQAAKDRLLGKSS